ncbi:hypothetical protein H312_03633 [Anncaliia algerae PRA339]|uniref:Uncharacterized protein n=1 Tax=Anncaliia algerae PRA339 TaxID=1288291 RepID=A0A059EVQ1_9MICR|nr:hypothetical protein H312_03633 [Anncaliia algerae PRA339]
MSELFLILDRNNKILNSYEKDLEDDIKYFCIIKSSIIIYKITHF